MSKYNGRVDLLSPMGPFQIQPSQDIRNNTALFSQEAHRGQISKNPISDIYFCTNNVNALQDGIRYRVWKETGERYVIGRQNDQELRVVMRSIYYQYAKHLPNDVLGQVKALNGKVIEWVVPEILSNLRQYERYRQDASQLPMPMERGPLMTQKGTKTLELKTFI